MLILVLKPIKAPAPASPASRSFSVALEQSDAPTEKPASRTRALVPDTLPADTLPALSQPQAASATIPNAAPDAVQIGDFNDLIRARILRELRYPVHLRRRGITGAPLLRFTLTGAGAVEDIAIARSSGNSDLDELALQAVRDAAPFGAIPGQDKTGRLVMNLPVDFRLVR